MHVSRCRHINSFIARNMQPVALPLGMKRKASRQLVYTEIGGWLAELAMALFIMDIYVIKLVSDVQRASVSIWI